MLCFLWLFVAGCEDVRIVITTMYVCTIAAFLHFCLREDHLDNAAEPPLKFWAMGDSALCHVVPHAHHRCTEATWRVSWGTRTTRRRKD